jgi:hypothetical protein
MEGWIGIDDGDLENEISGLARKFPDIAFIIDDLLAARKKKTA